MKSSSVFTMQRLPAPPLGVIGALALIWSALAWSGAVPTPAPPPIMIGITGEYGLKGSQAAQSIEKGIRVAAQEINAVGLLGGRQLQVLTKDDRGLPARALDNMKELAGNSDLAAVFCGRFSPVALELAYRANQDKILLLNPWAAADGITRQPGNPNYVFRLSLTDTWAMEAMLQHARKRGLNKLAVLLPNTAWGRSSQAAMTTYLDRNPGLKIKEYWYNWGDREFSDKLARARSDGARGLVMVANESEGALVVRQMAALPKAQRLPLISHWGVAAGDFIGHAGPALQDVDLVVVQTYSFANAHGKKAAQVSDTYRQLYGSSVDTMLAQAGFAHAYDLTHMLALAITRAGDTKPEKVRHALEHLRDYHGLVRHYRRPFSPGDHEALDLHQVFMARFTPNGTLTPLP